MHYANLFMLNLPSAVSILFFVAVSISLLFLYSASLSKYNNSFMALSPCLIFVFLILSHPCLLRLLSFLIFSFLFIFICLLDFVFYCLTTFNTSTLLQFCQYFLCYFSPLCQIHPCYSAALAPAAFPTPRTNHIKKRRSSRRFTLEMHPTTQKVAENHNT